MIRLEILVNLVNIYTKEVKMKNIIVFGLGYVGLSNAILLAQKNNVIGIEINSDKVELLNKKISPIKDDKITEFLKNKKLNFCIKVLESKEDIKNADYIIIATPTNFDENKNYFDTSSVDNIIEKLFNLKAKANIIIKSTIPLGYIKKLRKRFPGITILFSPEFLREGRALEDNLYPSRIIVGYDINNKDEYIKASEFANLLRQGALKQDISILIMNIEEAESVKLFSNTYLAMRVAYFNEVDDYAIKHNLNTKDIIKGMCADPRIGDFYNNPSFGYGGYCFPKDTKQLKANYSGVPNSLIDSIVESNMIRKEFIAKTILEKTVSSDIVGIYRLLMKSNSDNCRSSAIYDIIKILAKERKIIIFEPNILEISIENCEFETNLEKFKKRSDIILVNRCDEKLSDVQEKVFTRDIFGRD